MPDALSAPGQDGSAQLRSRSPHPYARRGDSLIGNTGFDRSRRTEPYAGQGGGQSSDQKQSQAVSSATSDSGTEADDERPNLLKALPPASLRPRKGLRQDERGQIDDTTSPLLTPSQLDRDGRTLSQGYFDRETAGQKKRRLRDQEELEAARQLYEKRRRAERIRRTCETALLGCIGVVVAWGPSVWSSALGWHRAELISQSATVALLILVYPLRVVSSGQDLGYVKFWQRFRVPASFDPASVLYPTFVPVLVALSLLPQFPALLLPNLILGLASLPPRLFPALSRVLDLNVLHWTISLIPLIFSENTELPSKRFASTPYKLKAANPPFLEPETLTVLYPLHQALLPPIHFLTTTSLLPPEKQLLSTSLVNLLCFALSPQALILKAVLWIGGVWMFILCMHVLHWNVVLARVPNWRLRGTPSRSSSGTGPLLADLAYLLSFPLRALSGSIRNVEDPDSDADEDGFQQLRKVTSAIPSRLQTDGLSSTKHAEEPRSAIEANQNGGMERFPPSRNNNRSEHKRRHTIASLEIPTLLFRREQSSDGRKSRPRARSWYLDLTPAGAALRKWIWALYLYIAIVFIILIPVRSYVTKHALSGAEPVMWALNYLFGGLYPLWTSCTSSADSIHDFLLHFSHEYVSQLPHSLLPVRTFLAAFGPSNTRLILIAYWLLVLTAGLLLNFRLTAYIEVDTRRKVFHGIMVAMLLPSTFVDPCFCALALSLVLAVFLLLEVIRAGQVSPLGPAIGKFVAPYVDGRDLRGPVVVSHAFLLVGCAVPLWLSLAAFPRSNDGWEVEGERREVAMVAGVVCVGMGDAAASLIGRRFGRRKWPWIGGKSLEGSAAFAAAVTVGLMTAKVWLRVGGWSDENARPDEGVLRWVVGLGKAVLAGCGASFMEAVLTGANDNVVVPIALWLLVRGVHL